MSRKKISFAPRFAFPKFLLPGFPITGILGSALPPTPAGGSSGCVSWEKISFASRGALPKFPLPGFPNTGN